MDVSGWIFVLVPAYPGSPGQKDVKRLCVCVIDLTWQFSELLKEEVGASLLHECTADGGGFIRRWWWPQEENTAVTSETGRPVPYRRTFKCMPQGHTATAPCIYSYTHIIIAAESRLNQLTYIAWHGRPTRLARAVRCRPYNLLNVYIYSGIYCDVWLNENGEHYSPTRFARSAGDEGLCFANVLF